MSYKFNNIVGKLIKSSVSSSYVKQGLNPLKISENNKIIDSTGYIYNNVLKASSQAGNSLRNPNYETEYPVQNGIVRNIVKNGPKQVKFFLYTLVKDEEGAYYNPKLKEIQARFAKRREEGYPVYLWAGTRDYIVVGIYTTLFFLCLARSLYVLYELSSR